MLQNRLLFRVVLVLFSLLYLSLHVHSVCSASTHYPSLLNSSLGALVAGLNTATTISVSVNPPEYVLVDETSEIELHVTNTAATAIDIIIKVERTFQYVEVLYPRQELTLKIPPKTTRSLSIMVKGIAEGEELLVITVLDSLTNHTLMEAIRLQVTTLRTVYIHAYGVINLFTLEIVKKPIALYSVRLCNISASHARDNVYRVEIPRILKKCDLYYEYYLIEDSYEVSLAEDTIYLITIDTESNHSILIIAIILFMPAIFFLSRRYVEDLIEALTIAIAASVALTAFALKWYLSFIVLGLGLAILIFDLVVILWKLGIFSRLY